MQRRRACRQRRRDSRSCGDPTEGAILTAAAKAGLQKESLSRANAIRRRDPVRLRAEANDDHPPDAGPGTAMRPTSRAPPRSCSASAPGSWRTARSGRSRPEDRVRIPAANDGPLGPGPARPGRRVGRSTRARLLRCRDDRDGPDLRRARRHDRPAARGGQGRPSPSAGPRASGRS